jgi:enterochelin esterase family protein
MTSKRNLLLTLVGFALAILTPQLAAAQVQPAEKIPEEPNWAANLHIPAKDAESFKRDGGDYQPAPETKSRPGTPKGTVTAYYSSTSKTYPGVHHNYWLYVPKQYNPSKPACLMVFFDGKELLNGQLPMPVVMDNLIADGTIPVMIGLFIDPGYPGPGYPIYGGTGNRGVEYDTVNGNLAQFLIDDMIPEIEKKYRIDPNPKCHAAMGHSSGGAAAFGVAWQRPDYFSKALINSASFLHILGADAYPWMVRQNERKPIRVFMISGANDVDIIYGDLGLADKTMASSLAYRDYDYRFAFGEGGHNYRYLSSFITEAMRWLWRD